MNAVFALGFFDSIHKGHRKIIDSAKIIATSLNADACIFTFNDCFMRLLNRQGEEIFLLKEREEIYKSIGIDKVIVLPTSKDFLNKSKKEFMDFLYQYEPKAIVCGSDYRFGKNAEGSINDLKKYFGEHGIGVTIVDLLLENGQKVSSSNIRNLLKNGEIEKANKLLCQSFFYKGIVKTGRNEGKRIGFPTLNIDINKDKIKIKSGVYVTQTIIDGITYNSVTNVGVHPTYDDDIFNVETFVLGSIGTVYSKNVVVKFFKYLRETKRFDTKENLSDQIAMDVKMAKNFWGE